MTLLGYIGNTAVYDKRLVSDKAKARCEVRIKEYHLEGGVPCLVLCPYKSPHHGGTSYLLYDGLHFPNGVPVTTRKSFFVHFWENGTGLHMEVDTPWTEDPRQVGTLVGIRQHKCHAYGCKRDVAPKYLMCRYHWNMVPKPMQDAVWSAYQPGQELGEKEPTLLYEVAAAGACLSVLKAEMEQRAAQTKRDEEFAARKREREEKQLRKKGGRAAKPLFPNLEARTTEHEK